MGIYTHVSRFVPAEAQPKRDQPIEASKTMGLTKGMIRFKDLFDGLSK